MASRYRRNTPLSIALALLLTVVIAAAGCTSAADTSAQLAETPPSATPGITQTVTITTTLSGLSQETEAQLNASRFVIGTGSGRDQMWQIPLGTLDEDNIANIQKAAQMLDGTVIARGESVDLMALLGSITEANGWETASEQSWGAACNMALPGSTDGAATTAERPGGGAEIVLAGLTNGAETIGCDIVIQTTGAYITGGSVTITNTQYDAGLELRAEIHGNLLVIAARDASLPYSKPSLLTIPH